MGNSSSKTSSDSSAEVRSTGWKTGSKTSSVPAPFSALNSFEKLAKSSDFKDWISRNLDSDYLVSSILIDTPTSEGLLDNVEFFRKLSPSLQDEIRNQMRDFELATVAGIDLHLSDTLNVCENELLMRMSAVSSPFFRSFQMRLIALRGIEDCIIGEKKVAQEERKTRDYVPAALNSINFPQLVFVLGLMKCGVDFIGVFPLCIDLLVDVESRRLLTAPIENLCSTICSLSNLQLFECWSPLRRAPLKKVPLNVTSVSASSGNCPSAAVDGKPATYWLCSRSRATWTVEIEKSGESVTPVNVVAIQIAWRPYQPTTVTHNSAPKKLSIYVKKAKDKADAGNHEFSRILSVDPELEYSRQNSWTQTYFINCTDVVAIQISASKQAASNPTGSTKMYSFEVLTEDDDSSSVNTLPMLKLVQSSLMPLLKYEFLEKTVYDTILSMIRISGSVSLAISSIRFICEKKLDSRLKSIALESVNQLLESMQHQETSLKAEADNIGALENSLVDVFFDETAKSSQVEVTQCGQVVSVTASKPGYQYCMLAAIMDSGTWEWDLSMLAVKDATTCFGVVKRPYEDGGEVISSEAWVVRCVDGEVRHGGKIERAPVGIISPSDVCSFVYDGDAETVTLSINGNEPQLLFEHVPKGISPVVFLTEMGKSVRLISVRHRPPVPPPPAGTAPATLIPGPGPESAAPSYSDVTKIEDTQNKSTSVSTQLLKKMAKLAKARMAHQVTQAVESKKKQTMLFEHPYCLEVSAESLRQLVLLLQHVTGVTNTESGSAHTTATATTTSESEQQVLAILQIIDSQLFCLSFSEIDPAAVGFPYVRTATGYNADGTENRELGMSGLIVYDPVKSAPTLQLLSSLLTQLRQGGSSGVSSDDVRSVAAKAFARGSSLFLPNAKDKIDLILSVLSTALRVGYLENSTVLLLEMLLQRLSRHVEVLQVIQLYKRTPPARALIMDLIKHLLFILQSSAVQFFPLLPSNQKEFPEKSFSVFPFQGHPGFSRIIICFLSRFQEQLMHDASTMWTTKDSTTNPCKEEDTQSVVNILKSYNEMLAECSSVISERANSHESLLKNTEINGKESDIKILPHSVVERHLRDTVLSQLLLPFLHGLVCISTSRELELVAGVLPVVVKLLEGFSRVTHASNACTVAMRSVTSSIHKPIPRPVVSSESGGWKVVKASFEDGELSYSVSDNGSLYTSVHSSNTCGVVSMGFDRTMKAAWEFSLEADSVSDECSVFGAARLPVSSRCYSSSPDLWMRRAYNGYMYAQGNTRGAAMDKIHPDDVVRIEWDGKAGTLSFSVNGSEPTVGFTDITETVYPACGSYRSGVQIRLLKVEVFGAATVESERSPDGGDKSPYAVQWVLDESLLNTAEPCVLSAPKGVDNPIDGAKAWLTARGDRGAMEGVHDWSFELLQRTHAPFAVGVVVDRDLYPHDVLGGPCLSSSDKAQVKTPSISRRAQRSSSSSSSSGLLSPTRPAPLISSSNWFQEFSRAPSSPSYGGPRRRVRIRGDSGDRERDRDREDPRGRSSLQNCRASVTAVAFQRLLRAAAPEFVPLSPLRRLTESDLNVDLDAILLGFLSPNDRESADVPFEAPPMYQQRILPTSFLSMDEIPFPQELPISAQSALFLAETSPAPEERARHSESTAFESRSETDITASNEGSDSVKDALKSNSVTDKMEPPKLPVRTNYSEGALAMAWHSDGTLWVNGQKLADGFGSKFLPLDRMSSITVRIDRTERTVAYYVNGVYVGVAFGPEGSDAAVVSPLPPVSTGVRGPTQRCVVYPAGSISLPPAKDAPFAVLHSIRLKASGFNGSTVLPLQLTLQKTCASVVGRLTSILLSGPVVDKEEIALIPWLRSPLLIGGIDVNMVQGAGTGVESTNGHSIDVDFLMNNPLLKSDSKLKYTDPNIDNDESKSDTTRLSSERKPSSEDNSEDNSTIPNVLPEDEDAEKEEVTFGSASSSSPCWETAWSAVSKTINISNADNLNINIGFHDIYKSDKEPIINEVNQLDNERNIIFNRKYQQNDNKINSENLQSRNLLESLSLGRSFLCDDILIIMRWLENILPEPSTLRIVMERSGCYSFPLCELPFLACLLKHSGLVREALDVIEEIKAMTDLQDLTGLPEGPLCYPVPSDSMVSLWRRVKQLRAYLRQQRQKFKAVDSATPSTVAPTPASPVPPTAPTAAAAAVSVATSAASSVPISPSPATLSPPTIPSLSPSRLTPISFTAPEVPSPLSLSLSPPIHGAFSSLSTPLRLLQSSSTELYAFAEIVGSEKESEKGVVEDASVFDIGDAEREGETKRPSSMEKSDEAKILESVEANLVASRMLQAGIERLTEIYNSTSLYSDVELQVGGVESGVGVPNKFDDLCDLIRSKALFLLRVNPANNGSETDSQGLKSKMLLLNLMNLYKKEDREGGRDSKAPPPLLRQTSLTGQERWRKVIEFLRVHSKVKKEISVDSEGGSPLGGAMAGEELYIPACGFPEHSSRGEEGSSGRVFQSSFGGKNDVAEIDSEDKEGGTEGEREVDMDISPLQAVLQSCAVFCTAEGISVSPTRLDAIMTRRAYRASLRVFALQAMDAAMKMEAVVEDPYCMQELLLYTRSALTSNISPKKHGTSTSHYLVNLEGCNADTLGEVQGSFLSLFSSLANILSQYVEAWEHSSLSILSDFFTHKIESTAPAAAACVAVTNAEIEAFVTSSSSNSSQPPPSSSSASPAPSPSFTPSLQSSVLSSGPESSKAKRPPDTHPTHTQSAKEYQKPASSSAIHPSNSTLTPESAHVLLGPIKMMLALWGMHFSSRDHQYLMQAGFLPSVYKLVSLVSFERSSNAHATASATLIGFKLKYSPNFRVVEKWTLWSAPYVRKGLLDGSLTCRSVILHLVQTPDSVLSKEEKEFLGLDRDFLVLCSELSVSEVSLLFLKVGILISNKEEEERKKTDLKANEEAAIALILEEDMMRKLSVCGVFAQHLIGNDVKLESYHMQAMRRGDGSSESPVCAFSTIEYNTADGPSVTGNYFEVTIIVLGEKDIGVGLADRAVFPANSHMPGWIDGSYGYHGDDGRKFGNNSTPGDWPLFEAGDVIGCGFSMERKTIFYTRNGELLGDCFLHVKEQKLSPIVGFSNRQNGMEKVEINFGVKPFRYSGPEIVVLATAVAFRLDGEIAEQENKVKLQLKSKNKNTIGMNKILAEPKNIINENEGEEKGESVLLEEKENEADSFGELQKYKKEVEKKVEILAPLTEEEYVTTVSLLTRRTDLAFAHIYELRGLQSYATSLLHFLLAVICRDDDDVEDCTDAPYEQEEATDEKKTKNDPAHGKNSEESAGPGSRARLPPQFFAPALVKNISTFGTPKFVTSADSCELQQGLTVSLIQELLIASKAMTCSSSSCNDGVGDGVGGGRRNANSNKSLNSAPSYKDSSSLAAIQRTQGIFSEESSKKSRRTSLRPFASVETVEIESFLYYNLIALNALLPVSEVLRKELCGVHATAALFSLLTKGSLRLHKVICNILTRTLPEMSPEDVEEALKGEWGARKREAAVAPFPTPFTSFHPAPSTAPSALPLALTLRSGTDPLPLPLPSPGAGPGPATTPLRRRQRRMPDTAVHVLLSTVRDALAVKSTRSVNTAAVDAPSASDAHPSVSGSSTQSLSFFDSVRKADTQPFGVGRTCLESADRHITMVQRLLEAPVWRELVACNITDSLRSAVNLLKSRAGESEPGGGNIIRKNGSVREGSEVCGDMGSKSLSSEEENILLSACAACSSLSGLGLIRIGGKVLLKNRSTAHLVDVSDEDQTARVYRITPHDESKVSSTPYRSDLKNLQSLETIPLHELQPLWDAVNMDLSRLSQPLLPHLVALVQQLLQWFRSNCPRPSRSPSSSQSGPESEGDAEAEGRGSRPLLYRLCATATAALSVLMTRYPDTTHEAAQDFHTVRDIISISSMSTGLPFFPTLPRVNKMWGFAQARVLELDTQRRAEVSPTHPEIQGETTAVSSTLTPCDTPEFLSFDPASRAARRAAAAALSCELGAPHTASECLLALEFSMGDPEVARVHLMESRGAGAGAGEDAEGDVIDGENDVEAMDLSDEYPLRATSMCDPFGVGRRGRASSPWRRLIPCDVTLERLCVGSDEEKRDSVVTTGPDGERLVVIPGEREGDGSGGGSEIPLGTCLALAEGEGPTSFPPRDAMYLCMSGGPAHTYTIVSSYDYDLGIPTCELVETSSLKVLKKYFDRPVLLMPDLVRDLDMSITILRLREISSKLLAEGNLNLYRDAEKVQDWLQILRLAVFSESKLTADFADATDGNKDGSALPSLPSMCSAILLRARNSPPQALQPPQAHDSDKDCSALGTYTADGSTHGRSESLEGQMVDLLVADVVESFNTLSLSSLRTDKPHRTDCTDTHTEDQPIVCASPHPYTTPSTSSGCISIPPHWKGALVSFHPLSATPSKLASLHFFKSKEEYDTDAPAYSFYGNGVEEAGKFKSFVLTDVSSLYYRFGAILGSDRPMIGVQSEDGKIFKDPADEGITIAEEHSSTSFGLGEDYSLFNLFNEPEPDALVKRESVAASSTGPGVTDGSWYFEVCVAHCEDGKGVGEEDGSLCMDSIGVLAVFGDGDGDGGEEGQTSDSSGTSTAPATATPIATDSSSSSSECTASLTSTGSVLMRKKTNRETFESNVPEEGLGSWAPDDVIGCFFEIISVPKSEIGKVEGDSNTGVTTNTAVSVKINVWFHRNGVWSTRKTMLSLAKQKLESCRPTFNLNGKTKFIPNFGESDFKYPPVLGRGKEEGEGKGVEEVQDQGVSVVGTEVGECVPGDPSSPGHAISGPTPIATPGLGSLSGYTAETWLPFLARPVLREERAGAWGYKFQVRPVNDVKLRVSRDFTLVWNLKAEESESSSGSGRDMFIWRAKTPPNYMNIGDTITLTNRPPKGALIVDCKLCVPPLSFVKVFGSKTLDLIIWRAVPPAGYVALGDVGSKYLPGVIPPESCYCVPSWAAVECGLGKKVFSSKKGGGGDSKGVAVSIWASRNLLGTFFGSPSEVARVGAEAVKPSAVAGVPDRVYGLKYPTLHVLSGEWVDEEDVRVNKSLLWAYGLLNYLLDNQSTRCKALTASVFHSVVTYIRSAGASSPLEAVPLLIRLVRLAHTEAVQLPMASIGGLCKAILQRAVAAVKSTGGEKDKEKEKAALVSEALISLVDLVIEVQTVEIATVAMRQGRGARSSSSFDSVAVTEGGVPTLQIEGKRVESREGEGDCGVSANQGHRGDGEGGTDQLMKVSDPSPSDSLAMIPNPTATNVEVEVEVGGEVEGGEIMAASPRVWWVRSGLNPHLLLSAQIIKDEKLEVLFSKETVVRKLRQIINFLSALSASPSYSIFSLHDSESPQMPGPYPRMTLAQIWYNHVSTCFLEESAHPYATRKMKKRIFYPGAEKLTVTFDRRCSIAKTSKMVIMCESSLLELTGCFGEDSDLHEGVVFLGCELTIELIECVGTSTDTDTPVKASKSGGSDTVGAKREGEALDGDDEEALSTSDGVNGTVVQGVNPSNEWGWGLLVQASGPIFESRTADFKVDHTQIRGQEGSGVSTRTGTRAGSLVTSPRKLRGRKEGVVVAEQDQCKGSPLRSSPSAHVGGDRDRGMEGAGSDRVSTPKYGLSEDSGLSLLSISRPRTRRGREHDGMGSPGVAGGDTESLPSPLCDLFVYPPALGPGKAAGLDRKASVSPTPPMPLPPAVPTGASSSSSSCLSSSASALVSAPVTSSSPSPPPPTLSRPCLLQRIFPLESTPLSAAGADVKSVPRPAINGKENIPCIPLSAIPSTPICVGNVTLSMLEEYVNDRDNMLTAVAAHGVLISEGELSVPHSRELEVSIIRKKSLGTTFTLGLKLVKSVNGSTLELNTDFGTIFVVTFTSLFEGEGEGSKKEEIVQRVQISDDTDAAAHGMPMVCKIKSHCCRYRVTALSASDTYDCLAREASACWARISEEFADSQASGAADSAAELSAVLGENVPRPAEPSTESDEPVTGSVDPSFPSNPGSHTPTHPDTEVSTSRVPETTLVCGTNTSPRPSAVLSPVPTPLMPCGVCEVQIPSPSSSPSRHSEGSGEWVLSPPTGMEVSPPPPMDAEARPPSVSVDSTRNGNSVGSQQSSSSTTTAGCAVGEVESGIEGVTHCMMRSPESVAEENSSEITGDPSSGTCSLGPCVSDPSTPTPSFPLILPHPHPHLEADSEPAVVTELTVHDATASIVEAVEGLETAAPAPSETRTPLAAESGEALEDASAVTISAGVGEDVDDVIRLVAKGDFTYVGRFKTRMEGALLSASRGAGVGMFLPSEMQSRLAKWSTEADYALIEHINSDAAEGPSNLFTYPGLTALPKQFLTFRAASMSRMDLLDVQTRILLFEALNKNLEELIPIINILNPDPWSLGATIRKCNRYIFMSVKQPLLDRIISATVIPSGADLPALLSLDNVKSMSSREKNPGNSDVNCFVQAYRQLKSRDSSVYRHVFSSDRVFQISFVGESGIDAGGVFREGVSRIIEDLFSEHFDLLLLCPNGKHEVHSNMDKYVPNPSLIDTQSIKMLEFLGRLMGMSLRVKLCLPFEFPSLVWKKIAGEETSFEDLMGIDAISAKLLTEIRHCDDHGISDEISFTAKYGGKLKFVYIRSDGEVRDLESGSRDRVVRYHNRLEYCAMVESAKAAEFDVQLAAVERGMAEVAPMRYLKLFSWQQLEVLVAGSPLFDFELWKAKTEASGLTPKTVDLFWKVMASLSPKEQSGFIRFAWGRSRLPPPKDFTTKMKLSFGQGKLPVAHTCFFSIELPEYATEEEMRTGLLTAINFGVGGILMG